MSSQPRSFLSLSKLAAQFPTPDELNGILKQIVNDTHDRGAALAAVSLVDGTLKQAILRKLGEPSLSDDEPLFGPAGPLRSFAAKIKVAFALRLFDEQTRSDLEAIREVRNAFAHSMLPLDFKTEQVKNVAVRLKAPERAAKLVDMRGMPPLHPQQPEQRERFLISARFLAVAFWALSREEFHLLTLILWEPQAGGFHRLVDRSHDLPTSGSGGGIEKG